MYRVYTEDIKRKTAERIAARFFEGFTVLRGIGCWRNRFEKSQVFEIDTLDARRVMDFALALKQALGQEAVLVCSTPSSSVLV